MHRHLVPLAILPLLAIAACSEAPPADDGATSQGNAATERPAWLLASAPAEPRSVVDLKQTAKEGDRVVLRGIIGGRVDPMSTESAFFVVMDDGVDNPCVSDGDDHCPTPWDYCCTPPEVRKTSSATVRLVDETGAIRAIDLTDHGIEPLDTVTVIGIVGPRATTDILVIDAERIHRTKPAPNAG